MASRLLWEQEVLGSNPSTPTIRKGNLKIILMRHGSFENPDHIYPGRLAGYHLSEFGREQVIRAAKMMKTNDIRKIYSSPLARTLETAKILAQEIGLDENDIEIKDDLIEMDLPELEGKPMVDFNKSSYAKDPLGEKDGESMRQAGKRIFDFLQKIIGDNQNVVVVSHSDPITGAVALIKSDGQGYKRGKIEKGSFFTIDTVKNPWEVKYTRV